jgi:predicted DNA-binding WGR domain protein
VKRTRNLGLQGSRFGIAAAFLANSGRIGPAGDVMTALTLRRSDPIRNMHRYYRLDVQLDLFGAWCFIREWGRIGQAGQTRTVPYPTSREAQAALDRQRRPIGRQAALAISSAHKSTFIAVKSYPSRPMTTGD